MIMSGVTVSDPQVVADQADKIATAWSPVGAPASWELTAGQFRALRDDEELLAIAATIPGDKLPPLLFAAAVTFLVLELSPRPLRDAFPQLGEPQPPLQDRFFEDYRAFCLDHRDRLRELCAQHRYQMNEVARCAQLLPALAPASGDGREIVLIDIGTGAGLALQLDRYRYLFRGPGSRLQTGGNPDATVVIETELRGDVAVPLPATLPRIVDRIGIDIEPLDLGDRAVRDWLTACIPQEIGAVTRFHAAVEVAIAHPARRVRGDACSTLSEVLSQAPSDALVCLTDTYVHVFFAAAQLHRFRSIVGEFGARRDLDWVSIDPLVPLGDHARESVLGSSVPKPLIQRARTEGVFGVVGRIGYRGGRRDDELLGVAHPGAAWLEWLASPG
jgi:hypothetical protein